MIQKVNVAEKFSRIHEYWSPHIAGVINDTHLKLARLHGEFVWHHHAAEDELFLVVKGHLTILLRDQEIHLDPGEFVVIPRGTEHMPVAQEDVQVILLEPKSTVNTGEIVNERTVSNTQYI